ncbi:uncharacterized protein LOC127795137 isoform X2 [Diospyros lotus]|uniref:uncharacterized protein LOC127795137 isoform X2 n=1 Tax=Diospyros lotus TaxID=55363 RepID=UPI002256A8F3|nr:uncharacterized protein LOC127795137 isoform X2 [Diospyros lotus]
MGRWVGEETPRLDVEVERAKLRCRAVIDRISTSTVPVPPKPPPSDCYRTTLLRLAHSELSFLSSPRLNPTSLSSNIGHIEAILHILEQPFINGVSRVCKRVPTLSSPLVDNNGHKTNSNSKKIHVDIVCTVNGSPVWFLVSARNPRFVSWNSGSSSPAKHQKRNLRTRIQQLLDAATHCSPSIKPSSIILYFSNGLEDHIHCKLKDEFGASEFGMEFSDICFDSSVELGGDWVYLLGRLYQTVRVLEIKVGHSRSGSGSGSASPETESVVQDSHLGSVSANKDFPDESIALDLGASFCHLISRMNLHPWDVKDPELAQKRDFCEANLINFDTTALIALISGISSSGTDKILAKPESELRQRFKGNYEFVIAQVVSEIQNPIHMELDGILSGKRGMICRSVYSEFKELVSMCGGPNEKSRADHLLNHLMVVPDCPSERMMSLPTTRKLALKNKIVFGTGDYWRAPTLTANMGFVRAVSQTGMSLFTIGHRPRALTGD